MTAKTKQNLLRDKAFRDLTAAERKTVIKYLAAMAQEKPSVRFNISRDAGVTKIELDHSNNAIAGRLIRNFSMAL
jgi:hypothetical protein